MPASLFDDVFITDEMMQRPSEPVDHLEEKRALQALAANMVDHPERVLPHFVELAMKMAGGVAAGLSLLEDEPPAGMFRWHHVCGSLSRFAGATIERNYSPCGVTLDRGAPVLTRHSERIYDWIADAGIVVPEVLLVPLFINGTAPLGTLWIVSDELGHFNPEHARTATELATFVGIALRMQRTEERLRKALEEQEILTREMNHRVKNLFALTDSMIWLGARGAENKEDMARALSGRLHALAKAHDLVLGSTGDNAQTGGNSRLGTLIDLIIAPYEIGSGASARFTQSGPPVLCNERAVNGIALVMNELATNAVKYGALRTNAGHVAIDWREDGEDIVLVWEERGGLPVEVPPPHKGFGTKLVESTIVTRFGGSIDYRWERDGLVARIAIPREVLSQD
ncbi:MAG TPA: HWE histidine kinase domain-containing protein [Dongiaceae bacterium]|nr:HWE histidine kinase domain-containing protein [Dongiaceae bacterium]